MKHNLSLVAIIAAVACNETYPFEVTAPEKPAGKVYTFAAFGGDNQRASAGEQLTLPVSVLIKDESGNSASNLAIEFAIASGGGSVSSPVVMTDANGLASTSWTLGWAVGKQSLWIRHGSSVSSSAFVTAEAAVNPLSDVVVVRDAPFPSVSLVFRGAAAAPGAAPEGQRLSNPDIGSNQGFTCSSQVIIMRPLLGNGCRSCSRTNLGTCSAPLTCQRCQIS